MKSKEIIDAYEAWDPEEMPVNDLCAELGITKQQLYNQLRKYGITVKSRRPGVDPVTERLDRIEHKIDRLLKKVP